MNRPTPDEQAADWLVRHDRGLTPSEQDEYLQWLAADPRHGVWLAKRRQAWSEFDVLTEWRPEHSAEPNPDLLATPRPRQRRLRLIFPAVLALAAGLGREAAHSQLASAVDVVLHLARGPDGHRRLRQVAVPERRPDGLVAMAVALDVDAAGAATRGPAAARLARRLDL